MTQKIFAGALFAGLAAGLIAALLQFALLTPLLLEGERYESGELVATAPAQHDHADGTATHDHAVGEAHDHGPAPTGLTRHLQTFFMTLVTFTGFALILAALWALAERGGQRITTRTGLTWGVAGFAAVQLAPALGLAPELPGSLAADIDARLIWWTATVACTAAGLALIAFLRPPLGLIAGALLIVAPHLFGAPQPAAVGGPAPPELSALFAARSLGVGAITWALLGLSLGWLWTRLGDNT